MARIKTEDISKNPKKKLQKLKKIQQILRKKFQKKPKNK